MRAVGVRGLLGTVLWLLIALTRAQGQSQLSPSQLEGQEEQSLETYFNQADQSQSESQWLQVAQYGVQTVMAQWNAAAVELSDAGVNLPAERQAVEGDFTALLQQRLSQWLINTAFSQQASADSTTLSQAVTQANYQLLYQTNANGIIYDSSGDPELQGSANLSNDQATWDSTVSAALQTQLTNWNTNAAALRTEVLAELPAGTAPATFGSEFTATEQQYLSAYQNELDTAYQRAQANFLYQRQADQYSMVAQSDSTTASSIATQIVATTNSQLSAGLEQLANSLSTSSSSTPNGQLSIDPTQWQQSFQTEFNQGMAAWSQAEQQLLTERAQWEQTASSQFQQGEQQWADAYQQLEQAQQQWEAQIQQILDTGQAQWGATQSQLTAAIDQAKGELTQSMNAQFQSLDTQATSLQQLATQAASMISTAQSSLQYWQTQVTSSACVAATTANPCEATTEISYWQGVQTTYQGYYNQSIAGLEADAASINGGATGTVSISPATASSQYLDDYQVALLSAQATEAYWQQQVQIAQAVVDYANNQTSSRPTEADTVASYQTALATFQTEEQAYESALTTLQSAGTNVSGDQTQIQQAESTLQSVDSALQAEKQQYQAYFDDYTVGDNDAFQEQVQSYYDQLLQTDGLTTGASASQSETVAYATYLNAADTFGLEEEVSGAATEVGELVEGDPATGTPSLQSLSSALSSAQGWTLDPTWTSAAQSGAFLNSLAQLGLGANSTNPQSTSLYDQMESAYTTYTNAVAAAAQDPTQESAVSLDQLQILGLAEQAVNENQQALNGQLAQVSLLTSGNFATWAVQEGVPLQNGATDVGSVLSSVQANASSSAAQALLSEATAQQAILSQVVEDATSGAGPATTLAAAVNSASPTSLETQSMQLLEAVYFAGEGASGSGAPVSDSTIAQTAQGQIASLQSVINLMQSILASGDPSLTDNAAAIGALAQSDPAAGAFLQGASMFSFGGVDYGNLVLTTAAGAQATATALQSLVSQNEQVAPSVAGPLMAVATTNLSNLLVTSGIATAGSGGSLTFNTSDAIFGTVWNNALSSTGSTTQAAAATEGWLEQTAIEIGALSQDLPQTVASQAQSLLGSLSQTFALELSNDNVASDGGATANELASLQSAVTAVQTDVGQIQEDTPGSAGDPAALLTAMQALSEVQSAGGFASSVSLATALSESDLEGRFVAESAVTIATSLYGTNGSAVATSAQIAAATTSFLSSSTLSTIASDPLVAPLVASMTPGLESAVASLLAQANYLGNPSGAAWSQASAQIQAEYADSVWNANAPQWFAGVDASSSGGEDQLLGATPAQLSALNAMYTTLSSTWGANGVSVSSWNAFLTSTYYGGMQSSFTLDQVIGNNGLDAQIDGTNDSYAALAPTLISSAPTSSALVTNYYYAAGVEGAINAVFTTDNGYNATDAQTAASTYISQNVSAGSVSAVTNFAEQYLAGLGTLNLATQAPVSAAEEAQFALPLLRSELGNQTLSVLSTTSNFGGAAAFQLVGAVAGAMNSLGLGGFDVGLLTSVLVDSNVDPAAVSALSTLQSSSNFTDALNSYLASYAANLVSSASSDTALQTDGSDRTFDLELRYAAGYLAAEAAQSSNPNAVTDFQNQFRGTYLTNNLAGLEAAESYASAAQGVTAADMNTWFSGQLLSEAGSERVSTIASTDLADRAGTTANESSFALGLNYQLSQAGVSAQAASTYVPWILSVSGVDTPTNLGATLALADGSGGPANPTDDALLLLLASPSAALWILKQKILAGQSISGDQSQVDAATWQAALAFQAAANEKNGYVQAAETSPVAYGATVDGGGSFEAAVEVGALGSQGATSDPVFAPAFGASVGDVLAVEASTQSDYTAVALGYLTNVFGAQAATMQTEETGLEAGVAFQSDLAAFDQPNSTAFQTLSYRAYLTDPLIEVTDQTASGTTQYLADNFAIGTALSTLIDSSLEGNSSPQPLPAAVLAGTTSTGPTLASATGALAVIDPSQGTGAAPGTAGPLYANALLEAINEFASEGTMLNTAILDESTDVTSTQSQTLLANYTNTFASVASATDASTMLGAWNALSTTTFNVVPADQAAVTQDQQTLTGLESQASSLESQIAQEGAALVSLFANGTSAFQSVSAADQNQIQALENQQTAANNSLTAAINAFNTDSASYATSYNAAQTASSNVDAARFGLEEAQAIETYASTGYLSNATQQAAAAPSSSSTTPVDPQSTLTAAQDSLLGAQAAVAALQSIQGAASQVPDFMNGSSAEEEAYQRDYTNYEQEYGAYLALQDVSSLISSAAAVQQQTVTNAQNVVNSDINNLLAAAPTSVAGDTYLGDISVTFVLNSFADFSFSSSANDTTALSQYLTGTSGPDTYTNDRALWVGALNSFLASNNVNLNSLLGQWALAFQYQDAQQLVDNQGNKADSVIRGQVEISGWSDVQKYGVDYTSQFATESQAAYQQLAANATEKHLYDFFVAMGALGLLGTDAASLTNLTESYTAQAQQYLVAGLTPVQNQFQSNVNTLNILGAASAAIGVGLLAGIITAPAAAPFFAEAAIFFIDAASNQAQANTIGTYDGTLDTSIAGANGFVNTAVGNMGSVNASYTTDDATLLDQQATLASITGGTSSGGTAPMTQQGMVDAISAALSVRYGSVTADNAAIATANAAISQAQSEISQDQSQESQLSSDETTQENAIQADQQAIAEAGVLAQQRCGESGGRDTQDCNGGAGAAETSEASEVAPAIQAAQTQIQSDAATIASLKASVANENDDVTQAQTTINDENAAITETNKEVTATSSEILALANEGNTGTPETMSDLVGEYWSAASGATGATNAVGDMIAASQQSEVASSNALASDAATLQGQQQQNEATYQAAVTTLEQTPIGDPNNPSAAYLAAQAAVQADAQTAFADPTYVAQTHYNRLIALDSNLSTLLDAANDPNLQQAQSNLFSAEQSNVGALLQDRMQQYLTTQENAWALEQTELTNQQNTWQAQMQAIMSRANDEWSTAFDSLNSEHQEWEAQYNSQYQSGSASWDSAYAQLETNKNAWVQQAATEATQVGSQAVLDELGQSASEGMQEAQGVVVANLDLPDPNPQQLVSTLLQGDDFESILQSADILNQSVASVDTQAFAAALPNILNTTNVLSEIQSMDEQDTSTIEQHVALVVASQAQASVQQAASQMNGQIDSANQSVESSIANTLQGAGFSLEGSQWQRDTVTGSTITGPVEQEEYVPAYQPFVPTQAIAPTVDLSNAALQQLDSAGIQAMVTKAIGQMQAQMTQIFGVNGGPQQTANVATWTSATVPVPVTTTVEVWGSHGQTSYENVTTMQNETQIVQSSTAANVSGGEFGQWVGASPVSLTQPTSSSAAESDFSAYLSQGGSGQMGAVLTPFIWSQIQEAQGWEAVSLPVYDQPLWNSDGSPIKAPTLEEVAEVGVAIASVFIPGGPLVAAALNFATSAAFTGLDYSNGLINSSGAALLDLGKDALVGVVSVATAGLGKGLAALSNGLAGTAQGVIDTTLETGLTDVVGNVAQSAISNITYDNGQLGFDTSGFAQSAFGSQALAGYLGSMAGAATTGALEGSLKGLGSLAYGVQSVSNLAGNLVDAGLQYGLTGETTLNVLNLADLTQNNKENLGLLQLSLGSQGNTLSLGSGGIDTSVGMIGQAIQGMGTFVEQQKLRIYAANATSNGDLTFDNDYNGSTDILTPLQALYASGNANGEAELASILSGQTDLTVGADGLGEGGIAQTLAGVLPGTKTVDIATLGSTTGNAAEDFASELFAGVALEHESYRTGDTPSSSAGQIAETTAAVQGQDQMVSQILADPSYAIATAPLLAYDNNILSNDIEAQNDAEISGDSSSFAKYVASAYDTTGEYWKLVQGAGGTWTMEYDGKTALTYTDPNTGKTYTLATGDPNSISNSLAIYMGQSETQSPDGSPEAMQAMEAQGIEWDKQAVTYTGSGITTSFDMSSSELSQALDSLGTQQAQQAQNIQSVIARAANIGLPQYVASQPGAVPTLDQNGNAISLFNDDGITYWPGPSVDNFQIENQGIVQADSSEMDCIGVVSYLNQTVDSAEPDYFSSNTAYEPITQAQLQPGDVITLEYFDSNGNEVANEQHAVEFMGSNGPMTLGNGQNSPNQIIESTVSTNNSGPRYSTMEQLQAFANLKKWTMVPTYWTQKPSE